MIINGVDRSVCTIYFDSTDGKYEGKTLDVIGEGYNKEFFIHKPLKLYWMSNSKTNPTETTGTSVLEEEKEELISYIIQKAKKLGYSLMIS